MLTLLERTHPFWVLLSQADVWLFSKDQREIIMLAKDYCDDIYKGNKPTILLHRILIQTLYVLCLLAFLGARVLSSLFMIVLVLLC